MSLFQSALIVYTIAISMISMLFVSTISLVKTEGAVETIHKMLLIFAILGGGLGIILVSFLIGEHKQNNSLLKMIYRMQPYQILIFLFLLSF